MIKTIFAHQSACKSVLLSSFALACSPAIAALPQPIIMGAAPNEVVHEITGEAPLRIQLRAVYSMHDVGNYKHCLDLDASTPVNSKHSDDTVLLQNCLEDQIKLVETANASMLGSSGSVTRSRFQWDMGLPIETRKVPNSPKTYQMEKQEGFAAGYVYDNPGIYYVSLKVTNAEGDNALAMPVKIIVKPKTKNHRKIFVSSTGTDSNTGLSEADPILSLTHAAELLVDNAEILLKRGETFYTHTSMIIFQKNVRIASYGSLDQPAPIVMWSEVAAPIGTSFFYLGSKKVGDYTNELQNTIIEDLTFDTDIAGIFGKSTYYEKKGMPEVVTVSTRGLLFRNNTLLNVVQGVGNNTRSQDVLVVGNSAPLDHGLRAYLVWNEGINVHLIGNRVANSTREHCARSAGGHLFTVNYANDFENKDLRFIDDPADFSKSSSNNQFGFNFYMRDNTYTSGTASVGPLSGGDGRGGQLSGFGVLEGNVLSAGSTVYVQHGSYDIMIRNNLIHSQQIAGITVGGYDATYQRSSDKIMIAHNTIDVAPLKGNCMMLLNATNLIVKNNLCANRQLDTAGYNSGVLGTSLADFSFATNISGNVYDYPKTFNTKPFIAAINPVVALGSDFSITENEWANFQTRFGFLPLDKFTVMTPATFSNANEFIPAAAAGFKSETPAPGVFADRFDLDRDPSGSWVGSVEDPMYNPQEPLPPANLVAAAHDNYIDLSWTASGRNSIGFKVGITKGSVGLPCNRATDVGPALIFRFSGLKFKQKYALTVCSVDAAGVVSQPSVIRTSTRAGAAPIPVDFHALKVTSTSVTLKWVSGGLNTAGFRLFVQRGGASSNSQCKNGKDIGSVDTLKVSNLTRDKKYIFALCSRSVSGVLGDNVKVEVRMEATP